MRAVHRGWYGDSPAEEGTTPSLIGRSAEMDLLERLAVKARDECGQVVVVEGEAGIGKTRLLAQALLAAADLGFQTVRGAAEELDGLRPFGPLVDCLPEWELRRSPAPPNQALRVLRMALPLPTQPPDAELQVLDGIVAVVEELSSEAPLVLILDDLQWADPGTILGIDHLAASVPQLPVLLVCVCRPLPRGDKLAALLRRLRTRGAVHLPVGPLDDEAVAALGEALLGRRLGPRFRQKLAAAGGNPLLVTELVRGLDRSGTLATADDGMTEIAGSVELSAWAGTTLMPFLGFLAGPTLDVLRVASVLGSSFVMSDLVLATGRPGASLMPALRDALSAGILSQAQDRLVFRHALLRDALYEDLPEPIRASLHLDVARALADAGSSPARVAEHFLRGARPGDAQAVLWLKRAADDAAPRAPDVAVRLLEAALGLVDSSDPIRCSLLADKAGSLMWQGRIDEAETICRALLSYPQDVSTEASARLYLAQALIARGRLQEAVDEMGEAAASEGLSPVERVRVRAFEAMARMDLGDLTGAERLGTRALADAQDVGDDHAACAAMSALATVEYLRGRFAPALRLADDALRRADRSLGREGHRCPVHFCRGGFMLDLDRLEEGQAALERGRRVSEEIGARWSLPLYHWVAGVGRFWAGEWDEARSECEACLRLCDELGTRLGGIVMSHSVLSLIALHEGDLGRSEELVSMAEQEFGETGPQYGVDWMMWARALLLEAEGSQEAAVSVLSNAWDLCESAGILSELPVLGPDLVRLLRSKGDLARAREVAAAVEGVAVSNPGVASLAGAALRCRGLAEEDPDLLVQGVAAYRNAPRPIDLALCCEDAGSALARAGRPLEARPLLEEAMGRFEVVRAQRDIARVGATLREMGVRSGARGPRRRPRSGWAALTTAELRVAELVAEGLSNPEIAERLFISRRTARTHVSHALEKLGLRSRVEMATEITRQRERQPAGDR